MPATRRGRVYRLRLSRSGTSTRTPASWRNSNSVPSVSAHASARSAGIRTAKLLPQRWTRLLTVGPPFGIYVGYTSEDGEAQLADAGCARARHPVPNSLADGWTGVTATPQRG